MSASHARLATSAEPTMRVQARRPANSSSGGGAGRFPRRRGSVADLFTGLRRVLDHLLHRSRRRAALASLTPRQPPTSVLVLCSGNIFRSPFAAAVLRRELHRQGMGTMRVESAGFTAAGRASPPRAIAAAARHGIDLAGHSSQLVVADLARAADLIVVMEDLQRRSICERFGRARRDVLLLGDLDPLPVMTRAIEDPVEQDPEVCERVYARIERCVRELARVLGGVRTRNGKAGRDA
jgi:protein-tyrosine-phosphatase